MSEITRSACLAADVADPLSALRARFDLPPGVIYLDGNSLGPLPVGVAERLASLVGEEWRRGLVRSWDDADWIGAPQRCAARLAPLLGASAEQVIVCDSTSVNLYKLLVAALELQPGRPVIVTEAENFPTDRYLMDGVAAARGGRVVAVPTGVLVAAAADAGQLPHALARRGAAAGEVAVVALTHVDYRSGHRHDLAAVTAAAHTLGALVLWDLSHSTGAMDLDLDRAGADLAVGCGYKYLNGGPGAPAYAYVAAPHLARLRQPIPGWMGHARPFAFAEGYEPATDARRLLAGTPPILSLVALEEALAVFAGVDPVALRTRSEELTGLFIALVEAHDLPGLELVTPRAPARRGSQVTYRHPQAGGLMAALIARGVIGDVRGSHVRFGLAPAFVSRAEVWDAVEHLAAVVDTRAWETTPRTARQVP